jgi:hypothetical protein
MIALQALRSLDVSLVPWYIVLSELRPRPVFSRSWLTANGRSRTERALIACSADGQWR